MVLNQQAKKVTGLAGAIDADYRGESGLPPHVWGNVGCRRSPCDFLLLPGPVIKINEKLCCCCCSITQSRPTLGPPGTAAQQTSLSFTSFWSLLKLTSIEPMMPSNHLSLCHPLILPPSIFPRLGSSLMSQLFASGGQSIGASASASVLPRNIQD